jgi:transposase InsO family protein
MCGLYHISHKEGGYAVKVVSVMELHCHMGHIVPASTRKLIEDGLVTGITLDPESCEEHCNACIYARVTRQPVPKVCVSEQASHFSDEIHTDVWGPAPMSMRRGHHFFITFMDDATRYTVTFLLMHKGDTLNMYRSFEAWARTQNLCATIKVLHLDRSSEYLSTAFDKHLADAGTTCRLTVHDTPQLNSIAERLNQTLMEKVHVLLHTSGMP